MSDEQTMPEVVWIDRNVISYKRTELASAKAYLRCDIDPDDAVVVSKGTIETLGVILEKKDATIATLTAERDALVDAIDAFRHIDRSGRHDTADLEQLDDAVEKCLRLIES